MDIIYLPISKVYLCLMHLDVVPSTLIFACIPLLVLLESYQILSVISNSVVGKLISTVKLNLILVWLLCRSLKVVVVFLWYLLVMVIDVCVVGDG